MKTLDGTNIFGEPKNLQEKIYYIEIALKKLLDNKKINLTWEEVDENTNTICPYTYGKLYNTDSNMSIEFNITDMLFKDDPVYWKNEEHSNLPIEARIVLRLAKEFLEYYKGNIIPAQTINSQTISAAPGTIISGNTTSSNGIGKITEIKLGSGTYSICDSRVDTIANTLNDAKQKLANLEDRNADLEKEVAELKAIKDLMLNILQDKGLM